MTAPLHDALPEDLRGPGTTITPIAAGLSGAGVYRVVVGDRTFVLKLSSASAPLEDWRRTATILQQAADAGLAPRVVHVDENLRAIVSDFIYGQPFFPSIRSPQTRDASLARLGDAARRVHELPVPEGTPFTEPRSFIAGLWRSLIDRIPPPDFVTETVEGLLTEEPPPVDRPIVLSHNDVNPTNLTLDGSRLYLLDWDAAGPNEPFYDLAAASFFFRMDDSMSRALIAGHDAAPVTELPTRFVYDRRVVAILSGVASLDAACRSGHAGTTGQESRESTPSVDEAYGRMRDGSLNLATADGQWTFGLAMLRSSVG